MTRLARHDLLFPPPHGRVGRGDGRGDGGLGFCRRGEDASTMAGCPDPFCPSSAPSWNDRELGYFVQGLGVVMMILIVVYHCVAAEKRIVVDDAKKLR